VAEHIAVAEDVVWPSDSGEAYGVSLLPLHSCVPVASLRRATFHELMALIDVLRVGRVRERQLATRRIDQLLEVA